MCPSHKAHRWPGQVSGSALSEVELGGGGGDQRATGWVLAMCRQARREWKGVTVKELGGWVKDESGFPLQRTLLLGLPVEGRRGLYLGMGSRTLGGP